MMFICPAGERLTYRFAGEKGGRITRLYNMKRVMAILGVVGLQEALAT